MRKIFGFITAGGIFEFVAWIATKFCLSVHPWLATPAVQNSWQWYNYLTSHDSLAMMSVLHPCAYWIVLTLISSLVGLVFSQMASND